MSTRRSRRKRSRARHVREGEGVLTCVSQRGEWSVLFLGLVGCLAGALITFVSADTTYAVLLLLLGLVIGAALWKREVT